MKIEGYPDLYWYSKDKPISQFFFRGFSSNVFIINQGSELWMIDVGSSPLGRGKRFVKQMKKDGLNPNRITKIIISHSHGDHVTGLKYFKELSNPTIYIHEADKKTFEGSIDAMLDEQQPIMKEAGFGALSNMPRGISRAFVNYSMGRMPEIPADELIKEGDLIKGEKYDLQIIHTPGHSPGHCCQYIPQLKALFVGDLIDPEFKSKPPINLPTSDIDLFMSSCKKLLNLDIEVFLMQHAKKIYFGLESNHRLVEQGIQNLKLARNIAELILKEKGNNGVMLKHFKNKFPKDIWPDITDHLAIGYAVIRSLEKENKIERRNGSYILINS